MLQLVICATILVTAQAMCFNDTPFTNFTWELDEIKGECIYIKALKLEKDKSKYEGRWYAAFLGETPEKMSGLNCIVWDVFWDEKEHFHTFVHIEENGTVRVMVDVGTPIDAKNGIYDFDVGQNKSAIELTNTFFYLDEDIFVFWHVDCPKYKKIRRQEAVIGFRRLEDIEKKEEKLEMIYKELKKRGAVTASHRVRHENCNYPPEKYNPYINSKKPKQAKYEKYYHKFLKNILNK